MKHLIICIIALLWFSCAKESPECFYRIDAPLRYFHNIDTDGINVYTCSRFGVERIDGDSLVSLPSKPCEKMVVLSRGIMYLPPEQYRRPCQTEFIWFEFPKIPCTEANYIPCDTDIVESRIYRDSINTLNRSYKLIDGQVFVSCSG